MTQSPAPASRGVDDREVRREIDTEFCRRRMAVVDDAPPRIEAERG
jgi:hypothetical protein